MEEVLLATDEKLKELSKRIDLSKTKDVLKVVGDIAALSTPILGLLKSGYNLFNKGYSLEKIKKNFPFKIIDKNNYPNTMKFSINHPIDGVMYANSDIEPDLYFPISDYHRYLQEEKMNELLKLCADLGAKTCKLVSEESLEKSIKEKIDCDIKQVKVNEDFAINKNSSNKQSYVYEFGQNNNQIVRYNSPWIQGEPTWKNMQELRINNGLKKALVEFTYNDDFGITADFATKLTNAGINIGGSFSKINRVKKTFEVEFYPVE